MWTNFGEFCEFFSQFGKINICKISHNPQFANNHMKVKFSEIDTEKGAKLN